MYGHDFARLKRLQEASDLSCRDPTDVLATVRAACHVLAVTSKQRPLPRPENTLPIVSNSPFGFQRFFHTPARKQPEHLNLDINERGITVAKTTRHITNEGRNNKLVRRGEPNLPARVGAPAPHNLPLVDHGVNAETTVRRSRFSAMPAVLNGKENEPGRTGGSPKRSCIDIPRTASTSSWWQQVPNNLHGRVDCVRIQKLLSGVTRTSCPPGLADDVLPAVRLPD